MPKRRKYELIHCVHFKWRVTRREGVWYADGRSNIPNAGRHSLGTRDRNEALDLLPELDRQRAEDLGLVARSDQGPRKVSYLPLEEGRRLYEAHIARPEVTGGTRRSTQKRYRAVLDKFLPFATRKGVTVWNGVTVELLTAYAAHLQDLGYAHKTLHNELTTLKQATRWLITAGHLSGMKPLEMMLRKAESEAAYCYRAEEIRAMVVQTAACPELRWLHDVIVTLACTGLRISELCSLRWADLDLSDGMLMLTDETGRSGGADVQRREVKGRRSRSCPIHPDLAEVLRSRQRQGPYAFYGPRGGRLKPDTVRRTFIREVIEPLQERFPTPPGEKGFRDGRLHSFRHAFCSRCANENVPERMVMDWLGHHDSAMIRHYYHLHDDESRRRMNQMDFLGTAGGRSASA